MFLSRTLFSLGKLREIKMHYIFLLLLVFTSKSLLAQETKLILSGEHHQTSVDKVTIVRTSHTPDKVKIKLLIPTQANQCVEYATRMTFGQNGSYCGYDTAVVQQCSRQCRPARPTNGGAQNPQKPVPQICENVCRPVTVTHVRSCYYPETFCARTGIVTTLIEDQVTIKFKDGGLGGSEQEEYFLIGSQKNFGFTNIIFDLKAKNVLSEVEIKSSDILGLGDVITVKKR
jgi:hypothetical protein